MHYRNLFCLFAFSLLLTGTSQMALSQGLHRPTDLRDVPLERVTIDDGFWAPKRSVWQSVTIEDCLRKFENAGATRNFQRVAEGTFGKHEGEPWFDGLVLELISGASGFLRTDRNAKLEADLQRVVDQICAAAEVDANGFLSSYTQLIEPNRRWGQNGGKLRFQHDVYNAGCLIEAAVHYYRATGQTRLLKVATGLARFMADNFGPSPKQNVVPGHALPEDALVSLYALYDEDEALRQQVLGDYDHQRFLQLAKFFIQGRGHHQGRDSLGQYAQDDIPVFSQQTIEGHAVRATLLCAGLASVAKLETDEPYFEVAERLWQNMTARRMYLSGGVGAIAEDEKFGADYQLPIDGYQEICAAVGASFFHHHMHQVSGDAKYVDELERVLYNAALSGVSLSGNRYLYESPLSTGHVASRWDWHACPCCPPMFLKLMSQMPGYIYSESDSAIYVNLYVGSQATLNTKAGRFAVRQETGYPFAEQVQLQISPAKETTLHAALMLRVPGWCQEFSVLVNDQMFKPQIVDGYAKLDRQWSAGDRVTLNLPMPVQFMSADRRVAATVDRVALQRGPLVYCFEDIDNQQQIGAAFLNQPELVKVVHDENLLGGIDTLQVDAWYRTEATEGKSLYRGNDAIAGLHKLTLTAIPFFAHSNRQPTLRRVWMPTNAGLVSAVKQPTLASQATWTASHCWQGDSIDAVHDQIQPSASDDETIPRFTWWDHRGSEEWLQCDFGHTQKISQVRIYWWDERRVGRHCRVPAKCRITTMVDGQWQPVAEQTIDQLAIDRYSTIRFPATPLPKFRIEVQLQSEWSAGVLEVEVIAE